MHTLLRWSDLGLAFAWPKKSYGQALGKLGPVGPYETSRENRAHSPEFPGEASGIWRTHKGAISGIHWQAGFTVTDVYRNFDCLFGEMILNLRGRGGAEDKVIRWGISAGEVRSIKMMGDISVTVKSSIALAPTLAKVANWAFLVGFFVCCVLIVAFEFLVGALEVACENNIADKASTEETRISMTVYWLADAIRRETVWKPQW